MLLTSVNNSLDELVGLLGQLSDARYAEPCAALSNATIGQHTRHVVEMFQCMLNNYDSGVINYDNRQRSPAMQSNTAFAILAIKSIAAAIDRPNKKLRLEQVIGGDEISIESNYRRELLYNLEHCIHHQALIKVALLECENVAVDANFGVAPSTIEYRKQCAQ